MSQRLLQHRPATPLATPLLATLALLLCGLPAVAAPGPKPEPAAAEPVEVSPEPPAEAVMPEMGRFGVHRLSSGIVLPYPMENLFRGYSACRRGKHLHKALDIGGVGPNAGIGTPIRSVGRARIIAIGTPDTEPARYGKWDKRPGTTTRGRQELPRSAEVPGYGKVYFFTRNYGSGRTGVIIRTHILQGPLKGWTVRYMHLAAVHPDLKVNDVVEAGQEIGLLGGTAVQDSSPHLHLDFQRRNGTRADVGPRLNIGATYVPCGTKAAKERQIRARYQSKARKVMAHFALTERLTSYREASVPDGGCGEFTETGDFADRVRTIRILRFPSTDEARKVKLTLTATGEHKWKPRLAVDTRYGLNVIDGNRFAKVTPRGWSARLIADGRMRKTSAVLEIVVPANQPITLRIQSWGDTPHPEATWALKAELPCAAAEDAVAAP